MGIRIVKKKWMVDFRWEGQRIRKFPPENSRKGALAYEVLLKQRLMTTGSIDPPRKKEAKKKQVLAAFVEEWLKVSVDTNNKPSERTRKRSVLTNHILPAFGSLELGEISTKRIEAYKAKKLGTGLSPKTINNQLGVLQVALQTAMDWCELDRMPEIKMLKVQKQKFRYLTPREAQLLLEDDQAPLYNTMVYLALRTGMRIGELLALHWDQVDMRAGRITISQNLSGRTITSPKNNESRVVDMTPGLHEVLREWRNQSGGKGLVFKSPNTGGLLHRSAASEALKRLAQRVGVQNVHWHALRHTFATQLCARRVPIRVVQVLMGHKSIKMTERYAHVSQNSMREAVSVLEHANYTDFGQYLGNGLQRVPVRSNNSTRFSF